MFSFTTDLSLDLFIGRRGYAMDNYYSELTGKTSIFTNVSDKDRAYVDSLLKYIEAYVFHLFLGSFAKYSMFLFLVESQRNMWKINLNIGIILLMNKKNHCKYSKRSIKK